VSGKLNEISCFKHLQKLWVIAMPIIRSLCAPCMVFGMCCAHILLVSGVHAAEFIPLGDLEGGGFGSSASGVSSDGSVVVGRANNSTDSEAYRWTAETGMVLLDWIPGGWYREVTAVSADGSAVVGKGRSVELGRYEGSRWTSDQGTIGLGSIHNSIISGEANAVSADGSVVVGRSIAPGAPAGQGSNHEEAFRWTSAGGMVGLGDLPNHRLWSNAHGVSADGNVVVGIGNIASENFEEAFSWTEADGMVGLGDLPDGGFWSEAFDASADGSVIVGFGHGSSGREAFRWTSDGGMVGLGELLGGDFSSGASAVSADGSVVVGNSSTDAGNEFFVWTQATGMQRLQDLLEAGGTTGLSGWSNLNAGDISDNGRWVVGQGTNPSGINEAFLAQLPDSMAPGFKINAGLNDAWYNPLTDGQGFFVTVFPDIEIVFLAWFTFDTELPPMDATANLGYAGHRWLTAIGSYVDNEVVMNISITTDGIFDNGAAVQNTDPSGSDGTIILTFEDCSTGTVEYDMPSIGRQGIVPIQRIALDNEALCVALNMNRN
jgi:probable HAF family extracellular repeat protein